ncbi:MAG: hypothetical protein AAB448_01540 [Patescibacteria group bacterium]
MQRPLIQKNGIALLLVVLALGMLSMGTLSVLAINSLNGFLEANDMQVGLATRAEVMGCLDEALIQLKKDNDFASSTVTTSNATCTLVATTPVAGQRLIVLSLTDQGFTRSVRATVTLSPFAVTQVNEP